MRSAVAICMAAVLGLATTAGPAAAEATVPALTLSPDGSEVIDAKAGIAWARCVEGMQWSGKACVGVPQGLDRAQAQAAAASRRDADGKPWRLPRAPEMRRLASQSAQAPAQPPRPFPATPQDWYWTSSTSVDTSRVNQYDYGNIRRGVTDENAARLSFLHGWAVHVPTGQARGDVPRRAPLAVRLVRSLEP